MASSNSSERPSHAGPASAARFNIDFLAVGIALALAALVRFNILPQIKW